MQGRTLFVYVINCVLKIRKFLGYANKTMSVMSYVMLEDCSLLQDMGYHMGLPPSPRRYQNFNWKDNVTLPSNLTSTEEESREAWQPSSMLPAPELMIEHAQWLSVFSLFYEIWRHSKSIRSWVSRIFCCLFGLLFYLLSLPIVFAFWILSLIASFVAQLQHGGLSLTDRVPVRRLTAVDALWAQEVPEARSIITAVIKLRGQPNLYKIREHVARRLGQQEKMSLCIASTMGYYFWIKKDGIDLRENVKLVNVGAIVSEEQFEMRVNNLVEFRCNMDMPTDRPPWELVVVDYCRDESNYQYYYVIARVHHAVADGISIVQILMNALLDKPVEVPHMIIKKRANPTSSLSPLDILAFPMNLLNELKTKDQNLLHGPPLCGIKLVGRCRPINLNDIKAIKNITGTTVNDVLMSCVTSSLANFFEEESETTPNSVATAMPIILRNPRDMTGVANWFSIGVLRLPMDTLTPLQRLAYIQKTCNDLKTSFNPIMNGYMVKILMSILPDWVSRNILLKDLPNTLTVSNVVGPQEKVTMWQNEVEKLWYVTPHRGNAGVSVSILSYAEQIHISIMIDLVLLPGHSQDKMDSLTNGVEQELHAMLATISQVEHKKTK